MNKQKPSIPLIATIAGLVAIIVVALAVIFAQTKTASIKLQLTNESTLAEVPRTMVDTFREYLYRTLATTYQLKEEVEIKDATIRSGTFSTSAENYDPLTVYSAHFIVDIPSFEQTYEAALYWPDDDTQQNPISSPVILTCPTAETNQYPNTSCYIHNLYEAN